MKEYSFTKANQNLAVILAIAKASALKVINAVSESRYSPPPHARQQAGIRARRAHW